MQIVIDITEERYKDIQRIAEVQLDLARFKTAEQIIANGTPLPKGHGRMIDESDLMPDSDYEDGIFYAVSIGMIGNAPTIIEADTEGSESE